ncbi:hypothetical protein, partial [Bacteroides stercorirosoris]|uniref:hypothetical protein n=1 Tax=Bacteroides stercorirosoris TaxID=871324 RepID=UPI001C31D126
VFWGECLKIQKRQLTRNELVALNFIILGISLNKMFCHSERSEESAFQYKRKRDSSLRSE